MKEVLNLMCNTDGLGVSMLKKKKKSKGRLYKSSMSQNLGQPKYTEL